MDWQDQYSKNGSLAESNVRFNAIPIKISSQFFSELERPICKFIWDNKNPRISKTTLNNKRTSGGITCLISRCATAQFWLKTAWYWYSDRQVDQWNRNEDTEMNPYIYGY